MRPQELETLLDSPGFDYLFPRSLSDEDKDALQAVEDWERSQKRLQGRLYKLTNKKVI